jgi:hypothetical protein
MMYSQRAKGNPAALKNKRFKPTALTGEEAGTKTPLP